MAWRRILRLLTVVMCAVAACSSSGIETTAIDVESRSSASSLTTIIAQRTAVSSSSVPRTTTVPTASEPISERCVDVADISATRSGGIGAGRNLADGVASTVLGYTTRNPDTFAGKWIDREFGTFVVAFTADIDAHTAELSSLLGEQRSFVEVIQAEYPMTLLEETVAELRQPRRGFRSPAGSGISQQANRVSVGFIGDVDDELEATIAELPPWVCYSAPEPEDTSAVRRPGDPELRRVNVAIDPESAPTPNSTELFLVLTEDNCALGLAMGDRLRGPVVYETAESIAIRYWVTAQEAQLCRDRHETKVMIELDAPVGERTISDGRFRIRRSESLRIAQSYGGTMAVLNDQLLTLGFQSYALTEFSQLSETFTIGAGQTPEFELSAAARRLEPVGQWTLPSVASSRYDPIQRTSGIGVWTNCGEFYLEILSLDGDFNAADAALRSLVSGLGACN